MKNNRLNFSCRRFSRTLFFMAMTAAVLMADNRQSQAADLTPVALRCEYRVNPLGIDVAQPRLTWLVESPARGQRQTAYQILVASSPEQLLPGRTDLWDSGKVIGNQTVNVVYSGHPLGSRQACFWRVCVWDDAGKATWSQPAEWTMGLLQPGDWHADYISYRDNTPVYKSKQPLFLPPARQYRKEFTVPKTVRRATIYATALGVYQLYLNGHEISDALFAPGWSDYHQHAYYNTYDVTALLKNDHNALGAWVADGWYAGYLGLGLMANLGVEHSGRYTYGKTPAFMAQLEIEYTDGSRKTVVTDPSWKVTGNGPVREGDFLMGESYDARKEMPGWDSAAFNDAAWEPAILAADNGHPTANFYQYKNPATPTGEPSMDHRLVDLGFNYPPRLDAFPGLPVRVTEEIKPVAVTSPTNGVFIFNLGQNFAGVVRLHVKGPAGTKIQLRYGEMLYPDGSLMTANLRKARATDYYILRGDPDGETWTPQFTYHGFQYVELTGYPGQPGLDAITGLVLHSATPLTSSFECSDPVANRLFKNVVWTQLANFIDLPTDCPQRDERLGWTGDAQIYIRTATYNADVAAFFTKWLQELMQSQRSSGTFPGYAPYPFQLKVDFGTAWADAGIICPWTIWHVYGDTRIVERCWPNMVRFMDWRKATSTNSLGIVHGNDWGDWLSIGSKTPLDYIDTVYFAYSANLMSQMASAIGKKQAADDYYQLFEKVKAAFGRKYLKADGSLTVDTQTAYTLALYMDLLPENLRDRAGKILADKLRAGETASDSGMTTGFLGTRPLLLELSDAGQNDLAVKHFQSHKYPSWGYEVDQGATTIWERWNGYTKENGFGGEQNTKMNSFAHYSFGAVCEWMFSHLAGIDTDGPGYHKIIIHPNPPAPNSNQAGAPIRWVKAHYDSIHGRIVSNWQVQGGRFELETTIPANTTATLYLPTIDAGKITESGLSLDRASGVKLLRVDDNLAVIALQSGTYRFTCQAFLEETLSARTTK